MQNEKGDLGGDRCGRGRKARRGVTTHFLAVAGTVNPCEREMAFRSEKALADAGRRDGLFSPRDAAGAAPGSAEHREIDMVTQLSNACYRWPEVENVYGASSNSRPIRMISVVLAYCVPLPNGTCTVAIIPSSIGQLKTALDGGAELLIGFGGRGCVAANELEEFFEGRRPGWHRIERNL